MNKQIKNIAIYISLVLVATSVVWAMEILEDLNVDGDITASGNIKIGSSSTECGIGNAGTIRFDGADFLGCNGSSWLSLTGADIPEQPKEKIIEGKRGDTKNWEKLDVYEMTDAEDRYCSPKGNCYSLEKGYWSRLRDKSFKTLVYRNDDPYVIDGKYIDAPTVDEKGLGYSAMKTYCQNCQDKTNPVFYRVGFGGFKDLCIRMPICSGGCPSSKCHCTKTRDEYNNIKNIVCGDSNTKYYTDLRITEQ